MRCNGLRVVIAVVGVFLAGPPPAAASDAEPRTDWRAFAVQLDHLVPRLLDAYGVPGAAVSIVHAGEPVWTQGYGLADKHGGLPVTADTVFQVGSISKPVAAWGVMRLAEAGKIDLDAPVERYLTRWHLPTSGFDHRQVTIRRILSHSAGLSVHGYGGVAPGRPVPSLVESLSGQPAGQSAVRVVTLPGTRFSYSGGGYTLLQLIVEEVTGERFAEYMQRNVLAPLGMPRSTFRQIGGLHESAARGYDSEGRPLPAYLFTEEAAAGFCTTAADLAVFLSAGMAGRSGEPAGRGVLSAGSLEAMFTPQFAMPLLPIWGFRGDAGYGLGYMVEKLPGGPVAVGHQGGNPGWRAYFIQVPEKLAGMAVVTNSDNGLFLINDLLCAWGAWLGAGAPSVCRVSTRLNRAVTIASAAVTAALLVWLARLAIFWSSGRMGWRVPAAGQSHRGNRMRMAGRAVVSGFLIAGWFGLLKPLASGWVAPATMLWGTASVLACGTALFFGGWLGPRRPIRGGAARLRAD